ncbi:MAG: murein DD-endopeptidase MepM/ murein hydrolase activator NlpD [Halieaceae bacterium]|jgi:murein DD-endopeptidase MepM/ murein hydrolase activator NlpD
MFQTKPQRGATPTQNKQVIARHHLIAVAAISALVALIAIVTPSGDVKAKRSAEETRLLPIAIDQPLALIETAAETAEVDIGTSVDGLSEAPEPPATQPWEEFVVRSGDNLSLLFKRAGFSNADVYRIVHTAPQGRSLERIFPGQNLTFLRDETGDLAAITHTVDALQSVTYRRMDGGFSSERNVREPEVRESWASAKIESSLFLAGREVGLSSNLIMEVANILGGVVDFVLDPRKGDTLEILYEELYLDGEKHADGKVIAASYTNRGERFDAFRYVDEKGLTSYYNERGVSMRKAFLMAPVDFARISSNFNPRRKHPIYKTVRPHNGTDYAAPRGTPVFAAGDGHVIKAGYSRANGNYVFVQHGERYTTKYLHLHKRKVKVGQRVVQSQVIGTVGSTGAATGPHLHYEFLVAGVHRNPRTIHKSLPKAKSLPAGEMPRFGLAIAEASTRLARLREERLFAEQSTDGTTGAL